MRYQAILTLLGVAAAVDVGEQQHPLQPPENTLASCSGYSVRKVESGAGSLTAELTPAGPACNAYGPDIPRLKLAVTYETGNRLHVKIADAEHDRYEVPEEIFGRPPSSERRSEDHQEVSEIQFDYTSSPFAFKISRRSTGEALFDSSAAALVFEPQYLRLTTRLPRRANIYGLGEHSESFRLNPANTTRTLWNRDTVGIPEGQPLYGSHPIYFDHRTTGTHGVLLMNSNGMDIKLEDGSLEYNVVGGVLDLYFFAGPSPIDVAKQFADLIGRPADVPYWSLGFHQCRYGYKDYVEVAEVITNHSAAGIPLETMWTDIDYMDRRRTFTNDPLYFPTEKMQDITKYLHDHDQHYILMIDPAVAYLPKANYSAFDTGVEMDAFMKYPNGSLFQGVVWPGPTVFPDWFAANATSYWTDELKRFFDRDNGIDVDGVWIDMNEASNFCDYPCADPAGSAARNGEPPIRPTPPPRKGTPIFRDPGEKALDLSTTTGTPDPLHPPYKIRDLWPELHDHSIDVSITHQNGLLEYDVHNLYGTMMSYATQRGMAERRPGLRTFVITRSTFLGAGKKVGKWLGDNVSSWHQYRRSIAGMLAMASIYQIPVVGSDVCGFLANTTETLCARWATLGAFNPFMRNHASYASSSQEFYRWNLTTVAAKKAIDLRYRLLDYLYTHFHRQSLNGTPLISPMWFFYPNDTNTYPIDLQFFYGERILVSPVTEENATSVDIYLPDDLFYDFAAYTPIQGKGATMTLKNIDFTEIPLHIRGGGIIPMRVESAMTTTALRLKDFEVLVAPDRAGKASGGLYIDDGVSLVQASETKLTLMFSDGEFRANGTFGFDVGSVQIRKVIFLGVDAAPKGIDVDGGHAMGFTYEEARQVVEVDVRIPLFNTKKFSVKLL